MAHSVQNMVTATTASQLVVEGTDGQAKTGFIWNNSTTDYVRVSCGTPSSGTVGVLLKPATPFPIYLAAATSIYVSRDTTAATDVECVVFYA